MTSKGRGFSIPLDVGVEADTGIKGLSVLRPMKDMLSKEIGFYNRFQGLSEDVIAPVNFHTQANPKSSIERLTEGTVARDKAEEDIQCIKHCVKISLWRWIRSSRPQ